MGRHVFHVVLVRRRRIPRPRKQGHQQDGQPDNGSVCTAASTHDPRMHKYYEHLKTRHKSIVVLAHLTNRLLRIIWYMLTRNVTYEDVNKARYQTKLKKIMDA